MRFKEWLQLNEAGHMSLKEPQNITVLYQGKPVYLAGVTQIDPRFEFMNLPVPLKPDPVTGQMVPISKAKKFLGDADYSLPIVSPRKTIIGWLASKRYDMMGGTGQWSRTPIGVRAPLNWADHAIIMNRMGQDMLHQLSTVGGPQAVPKPAVA